MKTKERVRKQTVFRIAGNWITAFLLIAVTAAMTGMAPAVSQASV